MKLTKTAGPAIGIACAAAMAAAQSKTMNPHPAPSVPRVIQGTIENIAGNIFVVQWASNMLPNSRQVDVSSATFEDVDGRPIPRPRFAAGDRILVVSDPTAPVTEGPPKGKPGGMHPMFMRLLPLRALVVEKLSSTSIKHLVDGKG